MKYFFVIFLFVCNIYASDKLYFLPQDSKAMSSRLIKEINISRESIVMSMYNFSYKKIAKELIRAKKRRQLKITVFLDFQKVQKDKKIYKLLKKAGITVKLITKKLHTKMIIFDNDVLMFGSMNLTKDSFKNNYEHVMFSDDLKNINKAKKFLKDSLNFKYYKEEF